MHMGIGVGEVADLTGLIDPAAKNDRIHDRTKPGRLGDRRCVRDFRPYRRGAVWPMLTRVAALSFCVRPEMREQMNE
jgi:hypothetical protein